MSASPPEQTSRETLQPFREKVLAFLTVQGPGERPISIPFGARELHISPWERSILYRAALNEVPEATDDAVRQRLVLDASAAQLALIVGLERSPAREAEGDQPPRPDPELEALVALSGGLLDELRAGVESLIATGRLAEVKGLSAFRNGFAALVKESQRTLGSTEVVRREPPARPRVEEVAASDGPAPEEARAPTDHELALARFRENLAAFLRAQGPGDREIAIPIGASRLTVTGWERQILWRLLCESAPPKEQWHALLVEGTAAELAVLLAVERCGGAGVGADGARSRGQLEDAVALATPVLDRLRATSDAMVGQGAIDAGRRLSSFRNRVAETVKGARRALEQGGNAALPAQESATPPREEESVETPTAAPEAIDVPESAERTPPQSPAVLDVDLLERWRERLQALLGATGPGMPVAVPAGTRSITLSPWEARVVRSALGRPQGYEPWHPVLASGVAVELTVLEASALGGGASASPGALPVATPERLAAAGSGVLGRTQKAIDDLIREGRIDDAKRLAAWRNRLQERLKEIAVPAARASEPVAPLPESEAVGEAARREGEEVQPDQPQPPAAPAPEEEADKEVAEREARLAAERAVLARRRAAARRRWRRSIQLLAALAVVAVIFAAVVILPKATEKRLRELTLADFSHITGITAVAASPPSLYVTVSPTTWSTLSNDARRGLVAGVGAILANESYTGATLATPDGRIVAEWLKTRGVEILPQPTAGGPPT